jgi:hypothetical protein
MLGKRFRESEGRRQINNEQIKNLQPQLHFLSSFCALLGSNLIGDFSAVLKKFYNVFFAVFWF